MDELERILEKYTKKTVNDALFYIKNNFKKEEVFALTGMGENEIEFLKQYLKKHGAKKLNTAISKG